MSRVTAVKGVFETLKADIQLNYRPGDYLPNERLYAEQLGVSRNTVREALIYLEAYGFVEKTQRGPRVVTPDITVAFDIIETVFDRSLSACRDVLEFRRGIDMAILPSVVKRITDSQIADMKRHLERMKAALTTREAAEADYAYHRVLIETSNNAVISKLFHTLRKIIVFYQEIGKQVPHYDVVSFENHRLLIVALEERSIEKAMLAVHEHYAQSELSLEDALAEHEKTRADQA